MLDARPCRALTAGRAAHQPVRHGTEPPVAASVDSVGGDTGRCRGYLYLCLAAVERSLEGACEQGYAPPLAQRSEHAAERVGPEQGGRRGDAVRLRGVELLLSGAWPMSEAVWSRAALSETLSEEVEARGGKGRQGEARGGKERRRGLSSGAKGDPEQTGL